jgi:hypothetical protein
MHKEPYREVAALAMACWLLTSVVGCGRGGPERIRVSGKVTYKGETVPGGTIYFVPRAGTAGLPAYAAIEDGQYDAKMEGGLLVGDYQVKIEAYRDRIRAVQPVVAGGGGQRERRREQYIPAKYNTSTDVRLTVKSGPGSMKQDFALGE